MIPEDYSHYHKRVPLGAKTIDVYRVIQMFDVTDPCIQHAVKKLLVAGGRGAKDRTKDIAEAIVTLQRFQDMRKEEVPMPGNPAPMPVYPPQGAPLPPTLRAPPAMPSYDDVLTQERKKRDTNQP